METKTTSVQVICCGKLEKISDFEIFLNAITGHSKRCDGPHVARYLNTPDVGGKRFFQNDQQHFAIYAMLRFLSEYNQHFHFVKLPRDNPQAKSYDFLMPKRF